MDPPVAMEWGGLRLVQVIYIVQMYLPPISPYAMS